jgi:capsular polysaccharide biosynthesis protein
MDASVIERLLETYFRRPLLYLVPIVVCLGFGAYSVLSSTDEYISVGVVSASGDTLLSTLSDVDLDTSFGPTPASVAAARINEQMRSDEFVLTVAEQAGLGTAMEQGIVSPGWVRQRVAATPQGDNLLSVGARTTDPVLSQRLAAGTVDTFVESVINENLAESAVAEGFYADVADRYGGRVEDAEDELADYLVEHPAPSFGDRPAAEQSRIDQLTAVVTRAQEQQTGALEKAEEARLATEQTRIDIEQRLRVVDPPQQPAAPVSGFRDSLSTLITFGVLGTMMTLAVVIAAAFLDRTIRTTRELRSRLGFDVVADVPAVNLGKVPRPS